MRARSVMNQKRFVAWLSSKVPDEVVGISGTCGQDALASYLQAFGLKNARVHIGFWNPAGVLMEQVPLPLWARRYIEVEENNLRIGTAVTAAQILSIVETSKLPETV